MKLLLPKQHGAWAMLIIPFILGSDAGGFSFLHIPLFIGWLSLYLATYPILMYVKGKKKEYYFKWSSIYLGFALVFLVFVLIFKWQMLLFGLAMVPFFFINIYFEKKKKERAFVNDVIAICVFCIGGIASFYLGTGYFNKEAFFIALLSFLFFLGSTFYVKTMIREKKNRRFHYYSWCYHLLLIVGIFLLVEEKQIILAYIPSTIRAFLLVGRKPTIMQVGILEIINSVIFLFVLLLVF
ncbi:YwiC-like family protein [Metabacillus niabensis]|uniref:YwiC-like family protein n=1 Tax=Metabacillus niabensis TaxID=324854 RepID=A0ABT9Z815_9BACI|nr:YwiC-like family protein [Metabacillus niabensis]MDQ0227420.1 hypothetical protein [Metabacillus niabensis]